MLTIFKWIWNKAQQSAARDIMGCYMVTHDPKNRNDRFKKYVFDKYTTDKIKSI